MSTQRIEYLDHTRTAAILFVIIFHAAMTYAPEFSKIHNWFLGSPTKSVVYDFIAYGTDVFIMPVIFFVAGFFSVVSLQKYSFTQFVQSKVLRILIPYIVGVLLLNYIVLYLLVQQKSPTDVNLFAFFIAYLVKLPQTLAHFQMWFLPILFCFYILFGLIYKFIPFKFDIAKLNKWLLIGMFLIISFLAYFSMNLLFKDIGNWHSYLYILNFQPARILLYFCYFLGGVLWYFKYSKNQSSSTEVIVLVVAAIGLLILDGYVDIYYGLQKYTDLFLLTVHACLHALSCLAVLSAFISFFKLKAWQNNKSLNFLAQHSYAIYLLHLLPLVMLHFGLLYFHIPMFLAFNLTWIGALLLSVLVSRTILFYVPGLNKMLYSKS